MRYFLYGTAGIIIALWLSLRFLGAAGFVAFLVGMAVAQLTFRARQSLNVAFVAGLIGFAVTLVIWSVTVGPPGPHDDDSTPTVTAIS